MLIITNRNLVEGNFNGGVGDEGAFGEKINTKGPNEVRLANANKVNGRWEVRLIPELPEAFAKINKETSDPFWRTEHPPSNPCSPSTGMAFFRMEPFWPFSPS